MSSSGRLGTWPTMRRRCSSEATGSGRPGAIADLEAAIDRPILTANQVLLWNLLRHTDADFELTGYGCLFAHELGSETYAALSE